jgi:hypothetical protein
MPKSVPYRVLERYSEDRWTPFAVAYRRGDRYVLFAPPWRAHRGLDVRSLEELTSDHFPSREGGWRWAGIDTCPREVDHPLELFEHAVAARREPAGAESIMEAIRSFLREPALAQRGGPPPAETAAPETAARDLLSVLASDPQLVDAVVHLRAALADPDLRPKVLAALEAFARAARKQEG